MPEPEVPPQNRIVHHCVLARLYEGQGRVADAVRTLRSVIAKYKPEETCLARDQLDRLVHGTVDRLIEKEILQ